MYSGRYSVTGGGLIFTGKLTGEVIEKNIDSDGEHVVQIRTAARNQRGETVMPGSAVVALPTRDGSQSPAARRARRRDRSDE